MQVLPPSPASQGPAAHKWTQPPGPKECPHAANGPFPWTANGAWSSANSREYSVLSVI